MKPDEIIKTLKNNWDITVTRRTLLRYETDNLIPKPIIETGNTKIYDNTAIAEFYASYCLINGADEDYDYTVTVRKCQEVRKEARDFLYKFPDFLVNSKLPILSENKNVYDFILKYNDEVFPASLNLFTYTWVFLYCKVLHRIFDNNIFSVIIEYNVSRDSFEQTKMEVKVSNEKSDVKKARASNFLVKMPAIIIILKTNGISKKEIKYVYYYPEDFIRICIIEKQMNIKMGYEFKGI